MNHSHKIASKVAIIYIIIGVLWIIVTDYISMTRQKKCSHICDVSAFKGVDLYIHNRDHSYMS